MRKTPVHVALCLLSFLSFGTAQQAAVPVEQEPFHHVQLKNDDVVVIRATLAPGDLTGYHIHSCNRAGVDLTPNTTTGQELGKTAGAPRVSKQGTVFSDSCTGTPLTHRVHNVGSTPMDVVDVEFLRTPGKASEAVAGPVAAENASARIYRWVIAPGTATPMHTHTRPYLIVAATPMRLTMTAPDGQSRTEEVKAGDFHWVEIPVTHSLANGSSNEGQIVEFELK